MFAVDSNDPMPIYAQLERSIRVAIATGRLDVGDQLPTVRQLSVDLRINANTVAKVYTALERAGVLETQRGIGTFVAALRDKTGSRLEQDRQLSALADRFLIEAAALGFGAEEAVDSLRARARTGAENHAQRQDHKARD